MRDGIGTAQLSELIGLIYDCAIAPEAWHALLAALVDELGAANGSVCLIDVASSRQLFDITSNIDARYRVALGELTDAMYAMWGGRAWFMATPLDRPTVLSRAVADPEQITRSRYYREWNRPQGVRDTLGLWLARDAASFGLMGFRRRECEGPFAGHAIDTATMLIPHLQRAATINRLLDLAALREASFATLFDAMAAPIMLVGDGLTLVHANTAARRLIDGGEVVRLRGGVLTAADRAAQAALQAAVASGADARAALGELASGVPLSGADGAARALHVLPLRRGALGATARAAIFVADAAQPAAVPGAVMEAMFGLTAAEQGVLAQIATGASVPVAARALGVAPSTVRTHLLHLYGKTGTRRQAELVRLAASLAPPVAMAAIS